jgi:hypothetical protein
MSTIVPIILEAERTSLLEAALRRERLAIQAKRAGRHHADARSVDARHSQDDARTGTAFANARDTDLGHPEVRAVGRASQSGEIEDRAGA